MTRILKVGFLVIAFLFMAFAGYTLGVYMNLKIYQQDIELPEESDNTDFNTEYNTEAANTEQVVGYDTIYMITSYDVTTDIESSEYLTIPANYIGKNREQIEEILLETSNAPTLREREKGFISARLEAFSNEQVSVYKLYQSQEKEESFYLTAKDDFVIVYKEDRVTIFMHTGINLSDLPPETAEEIKNGKIITSIENLYYYLESYTS